MCELIRNPEYFFHSVAQITDSVSKKDFIRRTLAKNMETPTFVTDGDGDDYYCPRFRMRNRRCLLAPLTTVILTLEKRKLHMYFFLSVNMVVKIQDTIQLKF